MGSTANTKDPKVDQALKDTDGLQKFVQGFESQFAEITTGFDTITNIGHNLQSNVDGRLLWLEMLKAVEKTPHAKGHSPAGGP